MVFFRTATAKDYRHFNIKTWKALTISLYEETVLRRYKRILAEDQPFPQLIIIDGGKGQLNAASEALEELNATGKAVIIGLAKNEEEIFYPGDKDSLKLPYNSDSLKLIRRIRDEVHRFGISFHRQKRSKGTFKNELENIRGIGKQTADQLLKTFHSVKKIRNASEEELVSLVGASKTKLIRAHFLQQEDEMQAG
jgi:excinuclease ABC subunit C